MITSKERRRIVDRSEVASLKCHGRLEHARRLILAAQLALTEYGDHPDTHALQSARDIMTLIADAQRALNLALAHAARMP
jgi:hypothetical protein